MKLLKLSSSNLNFKTIIFNDGLNIVAGLQLSKSKKETYNGIGKSFSLSLIHYIFGGGFPKDKSGKKIFNFLSAYGEFYLDFSCGNELYRIRKNFSESHFFINGEKILKTNYPKKLREIIIGNKINSKITFKQIFNVFSRRFGGTYYSDALSQQGMPLSDYYQKFINLELLGLNTKLIVEKAEVKEKLGKLEKAKAVIRDYQSILAPVNIKDMKENLARLIEDKENFIIAENYDEFKKSADSITYKINSLRNEIYFKEKSIVRKKDSLDVSAVIDVDAKKIEKLYSEANFFFSEEVSVRLEDAKNFHLNLMAIRSRRLNKDIDQISSSIQDSKISLKNYEIERDAILKDLNSQGALEEYNSIVDRIRTLDEEIREYEKYINIIKGFEVDRINLTLDNAKIMAESVKYLDEIRDYIETIDNKFRALVKRFYENNGGSFDIKNTVDAKYLFDIDLHIPRDASQGVSEVKIFCYDFLLYELNPNLLGFIAHDGCIFSEMDPRQKSMIFKVALEYVHNNDLQYFVNIGQSSLKEILHAQNEINILDEFEKHAISESVILELYDENPSAWLFGENFA